MTSHRDNRSQAKDSLDVQAMTHRVASSGDAEMLPTNFYRDLPVGVGLHDGHLFAHEEQDLIIGCGKRLVHCLKVLQEAVHSDASVLITGETGTGKELFARAIHRNSARAEGNFVTVDCTALPETIVAGLLFGHERGAFTGAVADSDGLVRRAHRGTLFLDEVGELSPSLQKVFLRVLDEHRFRPLGSAQEVDSDFRLVAATNRDLHASVLQGQFRHDLLYRLQGHVIELPSLRERTEDIGALACYHIDRLCQKHAFGQKQPTPEFLRGLTLYPWPGNIRELINTLEQSIFSAQHEQTLFPKHLPQHVRIEIAKARLKMTRQQTACPVSTRQNGKLPRHHDFRIDVLCQVEKHYLSTLMHQAGRNVRHVCRLSGLSRSRLYSLLKKHQISLH